MELMARQNKTIEIGTIMSFKLLDILFFGTTVKQCFRQCTEEEFTNSNNIVIDDSTYYPSDYAICTRPVNYYVEVRY